LIVKLAADIGGFSAEMEKAELKAVRAAERTGRAWQRTGDQLANVGSRLTTTLTLPIVAGAALSVKAASDEAESWNKVTVVFGSNADAIKKWAADSATSLGVSRNAAYQAAGSFGNLFLTANVLPGKILDMSTSLVKLSGDLASFHNADPTEVMQSIQSALVGQIEPMRKYGVMLSQDAIAAKALELGLVGVGEEMNDAAKMQAIYAIIMEQTKTAQGDFLNTSDGLANQMRILKADFENTASSIGVILLPYALQLLGWIREAVAWFSALDPSIQRNILIVLGLVAVLGPLLVIIGSVVGAIGALIPIITAIGGALAAVSAPVWIAIVLIIAALALLYMAWQNNWFGIRDKVQVVIDWIKNIIGKGMQWIQDLTSGKLGWISQLWDNAMNAIATVIENGLAIWRHIKQAWRNAQAGNWYMFGKEMRLIWEAIMRILETLLGTAWENIKLIFNNALKKIVEYFKNIDWMEVGKNILLGIANGLLGSLPMLLTVARKVGQAVLEAIKGFYSIHSESKVMKRQVGWEMAAGTASGWIEGVQKLLLPVMGPGLVPAPAVAGLRGVSAETARGGAGGVSIVVPIEYKPFVSTADEREARTRLAPIIIDVIREYLNR
jgi:hypothetical protein